MSPSDQALREALLQRAKGDLNGAIEALRVAASRDLGDARLAMNLAEMLADSGQADRAEACFHRALELTPDDLELRLAYGTFLGQTGHVQASRAYLTLLMEDLEAALDQASQVGDSAAIDEVQRFLGTASVSLGRAALACGDATMAVAFARAWLKDPEHGAAARALVGDALVDVLAEESPDLALVERTVALAMADLPSGWQDQPPALSRALGEARAHLGRAVMRGRRDPGDFPALLALKLK